MPDPQGDEKGRNSAKTRQFVALAVIGVLIGLVFALFLGKPDPKAVPQPVAPPGVAQGQGQVAEATGTPIAVVMADGTVVVHDWQALGRLLADRSSLADQVRAGLPVGGALMGLPGVQRLMGGTSP